eukprot:CAMPEP_0202365330 /NCGR_PEP_ID=MMETSP1126-20121109/16377_1 /ASSEMBLY_ACC=CAM_ASM_000457 /TAXON_ID=3047 /ORGANISM="Dunaliella tertiolecta, Strain CCMP1320" /LENGTH=56 /DNA_ID=CAMNT_0048960143 /DNA_START=768 /DNA_END=935 /DNA_ORIENTATION=+
MPGQHARSMKGWRGAAVRQLPRADGITTRSKLQPAPIATGCTIHAPWDQWANGAGW